MKAARRISRTAPDLFRGLLVACLMVSAAAAHARVDMICTHVTKSTLMQSPLVRPVFLPGDVARVSLDDAGSVHLRVAGQDLRARLRVCPRGGAETCTDVRRTDGDVLSLYQQITPQTGRVFAIWGRKGDRARDLVENVVLRCCTAGGDC